MFVEGESEKEDYLFMTFMNNKDQDSDMWYLDSGCSNHLTDYKDKSRFLDESHRSQVKLVDNKKVSTEGRGEVAAFRGGRERIIKAVDYAHGLTHNVISIGQLMKAGLSISFHNSTCGSSR